MFKSLDFSLVFGSGIALSSAIAAVSIHETREPLNLIMYALCISTSVYIALTIATVFRASRAIYRLWACTIVANGLIVCIDSVMHTEVTLVCRIIMAGLTTIWPLYWHRMNELSINTVAQSHCFFLIVHGWAWSLGYAYTIQFYGHLYIGHIGVGVLLALAGCLQVYMTTPVVQDIRTIQSDVIDAINNHGSINTGDDTSDGAVWVDEMMTASVETHHDISDYGENVVQRVRIRRRTIARGCKINAFAGGIAFACCTSIEDRCGISASAITPFVVFASVLVLMVVLLYTTTNGVARAARVAATICILSTLHTMMSDVFAPSLSCTILVVTRSILVPTVGYITLFQLWLWAHARAQTYQRDGRVVFRIANRMMNGFLVGFVAREMFRCIYPHINVLPIAALALIPLTSNPIDSPSLITFEDQSEQDAQDGLSLEQAAPSSSVT